MTYAAISKCGHTEAGAAEACVFVRSTFLDGRVLLEDTLPVSCQKRLDTFDCHAGTDDLADELRQLEQWHTQNAEQ